MVIKALSVLSCYLQEYFLDSSKLIVSFPLDLNTFPKLLVERKGKP